MFDRSRSGSEGPVPVKITLEDGRELTGRFSIPPGRTLPDLLNNATMFVEFEEIDGERTYVAKSSLRSVKPLMLPPQPSLASSGMADSDPFAILGLKPGADRDEVRRAYLDLAKRYHPDRYATSDLPAEVQNYLSAMARRINAAHDAVEATLAKQAARAEPIFTSPGRP